MAPYDSDSSGGEEDDFTETNVLLGYASKEASDDTISYLGGRPVRLSLIPSPDETCAEPICSNVNTVADSRFRRHGLTPLPRPQQLLRNAKSATISWSYFYN